MPIEVELPDGNIVEFPDGTSNANMELALAKYRERDLARRYREAGINPQTSATKGMGTGERISSGFGKAFSDTGSGLKQAALKTASLPFDALNAVTGALGIGGPGVRLNQEIGGYLNAKIQGNQAEIDEQKRVDQGLRGTAGGKVGEAAGYLTQILGPGLLARGTAAAPVLMPNTIRGMAAQGAGLGALQPVASDDSRLVNASIGAAGGAVGGLLAPVIGAVARPLLRAASAPFKPFTQAGQEEIARRVLVGSASDPARLATAAPSAIPGVSRTLAEESLDPGIASLQRSVQARSAAGAEFDTVRRANNAARVQAIQSFAGDEAAVAAARQARDVAALPFLRQAQQTTGVNTNRLVSQVGRLSKAQQGRPSIQRALDTAKGLLTREVPYAERAKAAVQPLEQYIAADRLSATNRAAAKEAVGMIKAGDWPVAQFMSGGPGTAGIGRSYANAKSALAEARKIINKDRVGQDQLPILYNVRKTLDEMLEGKFGGDTSAALAGAREIQLVKSQLDRVLRKSSPEFGQYLDTYKAMSQPINRMQVGQTLLRDSQGSIIDPITHQYRITPAAFGRQVRNLDEAAQRATGFGKAKAANILEPSDMQTIRAIEDDLSRQAFADDAARQGSDTFQKLMNEGNVLAAMDELGVAVPGGNLLKMLGSRGRERVNATLAEVLANPARARQILAKAPATHRRVIQHYLSTAGGRLGIVGAAESE